MSSEATFVEKRNTLAPKVRFKEFRTEWPNKTLEDVAVIARGKSRHRPRDASFLYGGPYPFIQTGDIRTAELYITTFTQTYSEEGLKQSRLWDEGTLCITIAANIAETAILKINACFPDSVIGLLPQEGKSDTLFVKYLFDKFKIEIQSLSQGLAQANLNLEKLSSLKFSIPTLPEQQKIASFLSAVDEKIQQLRRKKELLEQYKKGVMQQLFSGKLRLKDEAGKPYPKWETASLGDLTSISKGEQLNVTELTENGIYPALNGGISPSGYTDKWNTQANTITISEGGNSCGYVNLMKVKFWSGGHCYSLLDINGNVLTKFIYHFLKFKELRIMRLRVGSGLPNIQKKDLAKFQVSLPSKAEQQKIASFLSAIDSKIEGVFVKIEQTQNFKKGLLQQMFV